MNENGEPLDIVDAAAGRTHVVALASDGSLWSAGDGLLGQLGIGIRQFGLCTPGRVIDMLANETEEEFAEDWQRMDVEGVLSAGKEWCAVFCEGDHTLVLAGDASHV